MKSTFMRAMAAVMAVVIMVCCFTACGGNDEPYITKPPEVEGPTGSENSSNDGNEVIWDDPSTTGTTTTTRPSGQNSSSSNNGSGNASNNTAPGVGEVGTTSSQLTQEDMIEALRAVGYEYDAKQKIFYSTLNPWQRHFGFGDVYDQAAGYVNMRYTTFKADFKYDGLLWRLQWWKGQYGILEGAELGVYTKDPNSESDFYECASDENLLEMRFEYYRTVKDYNSKNMLFYREEQEHWWLTGFKVGYTVGSNKSVIKATLKAKDTAMANGIESGLQQVKDNNGNWNGFVKYSSNTTGKNFYMRNGNTFTVVWVDAGYENYQTDDIKPDA